MNTSQAAFEEWYVRNAFDLLMNPIGSRDCDLQRKAWQAAMRQSVPEGYVVVSKELLSAFQRATEVASDLFCAWENGIPCYEEPEDHAGYVGNAFKIADIDVCVNAINDAEAIYRAVTEAGQVKEPPL